MSHCGRDHHEHPDARRAAISPLAVQLGTIHFTEPAELDLFAYRGDSGRFRVNVIDSVGVPLDVAAATWDCDVRATVDDPAVIATLDVEPVAGTPSSVDVVLDAAQSSTLPVKAVWDLQMTLGGEVITLLAGDFSTTLDVSRSTLCCWSGGGDE